MSDGILMISIQLQSPVEQIGPLISIGHNYTRITTTEKLRRRVLTPTHYHSTQFDIWIHGTTTAHEVNYFGPMKTFLAVNILGSQFPTPCLYTAEKTHSKAKPPRNLPKH